MIRLFDQIIEDGITPNGLYFLMTVSKGSGLKLVDYKTEKAILEKFNIIVDNKITKKGYELIEKYKKLYKEQESNKVKKKTSFSPTETEYIHQYRELFPKGILPSGYPARISVKELEKRFLWFIDNYDYSWDVILKATKKYIEKYKSEDYMYMKTSGYFIVKSDKGVTVSTLASYCDMVLDGEDTPEIPDGGYNSAI